MYLLAVASGNERLSGMQTTGQHTGEKLLRVLVFTLILSVTSATMFNIVLPQISEEYHLSITQVSWISSAYSLIYAIGTVTYGKLADAFRLKNLIVFGLLLFAVGSLVGLIAPSFAIVLVGRCLQAAGAAVIPAITMLIPVRYFTPERRGAALGVVAAGLALGTALAPVIAALIASVVSWRWLFCIPFLGLLTLPFYRKYLGEEERHPQLFDWIGGLLLALAIALLLLGITNDWRFAPGGLLTMALFLVRIHFAESPFVQPHLFKNGRYSLGLMLSFLVSGMGFSFIFLSPLLFANVYKLEPGWVGLAMVPAAIASVILGRTAGRLADQKGNAYLFFVASGLLITCFAGLSTFTGSSPLVLAAILMLGNAGQSFMLITLSNSLSRTLQKEQIGVGMGLFSMLNFIAASVVITIYGRVVDLGATSFWNPLNVFPGGMVFSNIYLVQTLLYLGIVVFYSTVMVRVWSVDAR